MARGTGLAPILPAVVVLALALAPVVEPGGRWTGTGLVAQAAGDRRAAESRALREAQVLETAGDRAGSERVLRSFLGEQPASTGGLFALERILRAQGRLGELLPLVDRGITTGENGTAVRFLKLRILVEVDSLEAVQPEVDRWIAEEPGSLDPFREGARALERAHGPDAALALLQRGRSVLGPSSPLALDAGDVLLRAGKPAEAGLRWAEGLSADPTQLPAVLRRIQGIGGDRSEAVRPMVEALGQDPSNPSRLRTGALLALEGRLMDLARALSEQAAAGLRGAERSGFLTQLAREAGTAGEAELALWALESLREGASPAEARSLDAQIATLALAAGDSARALRARNREAESWPRGSSDRRRALAAAIRLEASSAPVAAVQARVAAFRTEFPAATELDDVSGVLARQLLALGDSAAARGVLQTLDGPAAARERAFMTLAGPTPREARDDLLAALPAVPGIQATEFLQLVSLMDALGDPGVELAAAAALRAFRGDPAGGLALIVDGVGGLPAADRPGLLALGSRLATDAGHEDEAMRLREELVEGYPASAEAGEATLSLARWRARTDEGVPAAIRLLESFIVTRPTSPVAPEARRELARLQQRVP
jgi:hypothetical protein